MIKQLLENLKYSLIVALFWPLPIILVFQALSHQFNFKVLIYWYVTCVGLNLFFAWMMPKSYFTSSDNINDEVSQ